MSPADVFVTLAAAALYGLAAGIAAGFVIVLAHRAMQRRSGA